MGKTEAGAIWLDKKFLSAYDYWQFWRNTDDRDVIKFLKIFTDLEINEIKQFTNNNINELKVLLANKVTTSMLHGKKASYKILSKLLKKLFQVMHLDLIYLQLKLNPKHFNNKINIIDLIIFSKLEKSKSEVRRLIKGNAIKIDDEL